MARGKGRDIELFGEEWLMRCRETKMTRQEAIANSKRVGHIDAIGLVNVLEALGLLKFEEEYDLGKEKYDSNKEIYDIIHAHYELPNNLIHDLHVRGYKIVHNFEEKKKNGNGVANCIGFAYNYLVGQREFGVDQRDLTKIGETFIEDLARSGYKIVRNT